MPDKVENIRLHKIIMIIVYFGDWPWYFPYFLESCKYNRSISFVIFSNNDPKYQKLPANVKLMDYSISQFCEDAARILGFEVDVRHAYKICDFKPAFGLILQKYISGFDFWGYCDIDLIYGNIRNFITEEYSMSICLDNFSLKFSWKS